MNYTQSQFNIIKQMVHEFSCLENHKMRKEKISWYSLASGIKNDDIVSQIMIDLMAI